MTMTRRVAVGGLASVPLLLAGAAGGVFAAAPMTVWRTPGCGCCHKWAGAMATAGLPVALVDVDDLSSVQSRLGVPEALQGCHAGEIGGYVVSGHVPPADVQRLLAERPAGRGLAVPGMPVGSPGMEGGTPERYDVLLFQADGTSRVFATHG